MKAWRLYPLAAFVAGQATNLARGQLATSAAPATKTAVSPNLDGISSFSYDYYPTTRTEIWSTTETSVTHPGWVAPTVVTMITTRTITSLVPGPLTSYPATLVETVISSATYEYRMTYSDGHSSTSWSWATHTYPSTVVIPVPIDQSATLIASE